MQKRCQCVNITPYCCQGRLEVLAGSRFTKDAECRYAPVEGECLAVAWALQQTRHYTLGNPRLLVATDHKPLVKILGDKKLESIPNPRLLRLKEQTLAWKFDMLHVPGRVHLGPDTLSRKEVASIIVNMIGDTDEEEEFREERILSSATVSTLESMIEAETAAAFLGMNDNIHNGAVPITWEQLKHEVGKDKISSMLCNQIKDGFPEHDDKKKMRPEVQSYWKHREHLTQVDRVPLYKDRVVVPPVLRPAVLEILHGAHQGEKGMQLRASSSVWWPGITPQITEKRKTCRVCNQIAPSQPMAPPEPLQMPDFPFQQLASDYFQLSGRTYLVIVDRYSGWPVVAYCGGSTGNPKMLTDKLR